MKSLWSWQVWNILYNREAHRCDPWATSWWGGQVRLVLMAATKPARDHMTEFSRGLSAPGAWATETHWTTTAHMAPSAYKPQQWRLLYGNLWWLILAPENNSSSLTASILGINSPHTHFWGCVMVTISVSREV